jgi:hypothetical protein
MRFLAVLAFVAPAIANADNLMEFSESSRWKDPELALGASLFVGGYATSVVWAQEREGDQDALYVPVIGPWLELFTLPDCGDRDMYCAHSNATRGVLVVSGVAQLVGVGLTVHALAKHNDPKPVLIAPTWSNGGPGVSLRGKF